MTSHRRDFLRSLLTAGATSATAVAFPPAIRRALAIPAHRRTGTLADVEHVVILMQENRSFDHYFGTLNGVRGFADRFPIPLSGGRTVWPQRNGAGRVVPPFPLDTAAHFAHMRVTGTPHSWPNAQPAWADGKLDEWPRYKDDHAMGYFRRDDLPFQFALAEAFTICDAYHCSFQGGTNPNRLFLWSGTNDPMARGMGPALTNDYDSVGHDPHNGYTWRTYAERLQAAGVSWQVYQDMADNFTDNSLAGFRSFRAAYFGEPGSQPALRERGLATRDLDLLAEDVAADRLPAVSWIVATAEGSEHPGPSSPAQGADYTARVLEALTCNPDVWSKTVLFVNFDENDGFFDHVPPPAAPSQLTSSPATFAGASTVDTAAEYHRILPAGIDPAGAMPLHKPYGLGPRVPMYVISPWSKGGWVDSEVFDHTSVIRFLEKRFGVREPNISPWRRAVCGDLTSAFDFADPDHGGFLEDLPETLELAERARALPSTTTPPTPETPALPSQEEGPRPSRALPYQLEVSAEVRGGARAAHGAVDRAVVRESRRRRRGLPRLRPPPPRPRAAALYRRGRQAAGRALAARRRRRRVRPLGDRAQRLSPPLRRASRGLRRGRRLRRRRARAGLRPRRSGDHSAQPRRGGPPGPALAQRLRERRPARDPGAGRRQPPPPRRAPPQRALV